MVRASAGATSIAEPETSDYAFLQVYGDHDKVAGAAGNFCIKPMRQAKLHT